MHKICIGRIFHPRLKHDHKYGLRQLIHQKKLFLIFLLLIIISIKLLSIAKIDSLEAVLSKISGEERVTILNKLSSLYTNVNQNISYDYAAQAYELSKKKNDKIEVDIN